MALSIRQKRSTWNVGTLTGRSLEVVEELQRRMVDVAALQEIRWKGEGTRFVEAKGGRYKLWWKGDDGTGGVGVMVREELVEKVLEVRRRSNGVIVMVMVFGKVIVRVISGYAPQQSRKEEEKDRFYDDVSDEIGQAGLNEFVVLLGDLNGHVGADADGYEGVHEEGRRVLELADAHSMFTALKHKIDCELYILNDEKKNNGSPTALQQALSGQGVPRIPGKYAIVEGCCRKIQNGPSMVLGTLNVASLTGPSMKNAEMLERKRIDICCLQEIRWKSNGVCHVNSDKGKI
ncbi:hypothetical protein HELRODRAFT_165025 [Helobdella robusta]|uniref:Endonuclease/exonuclease/phosphatase domain-containing protein n=1 Tax=Helobdella robusta TaxID=6412 RepID=T1EW58_HELRO|nr:hypothetical protein HELRODRAFT_165025 [Helobdella robusta]ESN92893.1 hypothetical protein HELRODRAFT_165025 [Helobdella robusta]